MPRFEVFSIDAIRTARTDSPDYCHHALEGAALAAPPLLSEVRPLREGSALAWAVAFMESRRIAASELAAKSFQNRDNHLQYIENRDFIA